MEYLLVALAVLTLVALYVTWLAGRIERLHARAAAARDALEDQLVRRASAATALAGLPGAGPEADRLRQAARAARAALAAQAAGLDLRQAAENELTRALRAASLDPSDPTVAAATAANRRLAVARQVYNDAVRDTRALRQAKVPRAFRLGARHRMPHYFDIDEFDVDAPRVAPRATAPARTAGPAGVGEATPGTA